MKKCETCGNWDGEDGYHACPPLLEVWEESEPEDSLRKIYDSSPFTAAEEFAEAYDLGADYSIVEGTNITVCVKSPDGNVSKFEVSGEATPTYYATKLEED
jgi:hypothetical protein